MGRAFEYRKARKLKRWGHMARTFTKLGKEIEIAVKAGGSDPSGNTRLRILIQNAKAENMPKENIERAIKRATEKDAADYKEVFYEGYGPHGIALLVKVENNPDLRFRARHDGTAIGHHAALLHNAALCKVRRRVEHGHVKGHLRLRAVLDLHLGARVLHAFLKFQAVEGGQRGHTQIDARVVHGDHRVLAGLQAFKRKRQFTCGI